MRILILTQKMDKNDPILGFFNTWVEKMAGEVKSIKVICLEEGEHNLPPNVQVYSLGKESGRSKLKYLYNFYKYIFKLKNEYDTVFVHMNPEYVVLGGLFWRMFNKKIALWYTHREVDLKLRIAEKFSDIIFTASKESFRLLSDKLKVMGHGIDLNSYNVPAYKEHTGPIKIIQVGRITPIKHCTEAVEALYILRDSWVRDVSLRFVGEPTTDEDKAYFKKLMKLVETRGVSEQVKFVGSVSKDKIVKEYEGCDISLNLLPTGGLDKAVFESMASGRLVVSSNQAFKEYLGDKLILKDFSARTVSEKIKDIFNQGGLENVTITLKHTAENKANLDSLIKNIIKELR